MATVAPIAGGVEDTPLQITYANLAAAANEADPDGDALSFRIESVMGRLLQPILLRFIFHRVLTVSTPMGRRVRGAARGAPLIRTRPQDLATGGVKRAPRTVGVSDGRPMLEDGRSLDVANVVWCTGFHPGFSWIDLPVFGPTGAPMHDRGIVEKEPGLYFVGLHFLYAMSSVMIHGAARDAKYIADAIVARCRAKAASAA